MSVELAKEINNSIFNPEVKIQFLNEMHESGQISEDTVRSYLRIFALIKKHEVALNRDIREFDFKALETVLDGFEAKHRNTVESYARIISSYLNWSVKQGYIEENNLAHLKPDDFVKYVVNTERYFTYKQLVRYEDDCVNYQDSVLIRMLFLGIGGKQLSEIRNLRKQDINWEAQTLLLRETLKAEKDGTPIKYSERTLHVEDDQLFKLLKGAIEKDIYYKKNGDMEFYENIRPYNDLAKSDYVIRPSITKTDSAYRPVDKFVIYRRLDSVKKSLEIEQLTAKFIQRSGMIYFAKQLIGDGELTLDDLKIVAERFKIKSYHNLKGFLTMENILRTYPNKL